MKSVRFERSLLIILAYIIGFTTAFIAFNQSLNQSNSVPQIASTGKVMEEKNDWELILNDVGLFIKQGDNERILSANKNSLSMDADIERVGFHHKITNAQVSPSKKFIFYCELLSMTSEGCVPVVYDIEKDTAHLVSLPDTEGVVVLNYNDNPWSDDDLLTINDFQSHSSDQPWK